VTYRRYANLLLHVGSVIFVLSGDLQQQVYHSSLQTLMHTPRSFIVNNLLSFYLYGFLIACTNHRAVFYVGKYNYVMHFYLYLLPLFILQHLPTSMTWTTLKSKN